MLYKTIALELIREDQGFYERLRSTNRLLPSMDAYAGDLREIHLAWVGRLAARHPGRDTRLIASEAMELAIEDLRSRLPSGSAGAGGVPIPAKETATGSSKG